MTNVSRCLFGAFLAVAGSSMVAAQTSAPVPKVMQITREYTKPGKGGMAHDKVESAFAQAMARAKWPTHYIGMTSLSGKQRALFLSLYDSYEAMEKDYTSMMKNAALSAELERDSVADGELLDSMDQGIFVYREDMSLRTMTDLAHQRYLEISSYHVREGHMPEWEEIVKMVKAAYEKGVPNSHWAMYEQTYGGDGGTFLVLSSRKTLAELDAGPMEDKQFAAAMGEDGMKKFRELIASALGPAQYQLFAFNPKMSYVEDSWIKEDPDFWKPKPVAAPAAKAAAADKKPTP
ncbi:MAG TPA: hypothetical protein VH161_00895 [Candidatus Acidoferrales bacterium]|nr:hypothetical protein [Candidatus Acidoferrales bacterium]